MNPDEIRLCRWVDGDQAIDDALLAVRRNPNGRFVIDVSLHGGPRIVQRSLLMLQRAGARVVEPLELLNEGYPATDALEREILPLLLKAKTRAVAIWLAGMVRRLPERIREIQAGLTAGRVDWARQQLADLCRAGDRARILLNGVRVVVVGAPNTGKSSLINSLAGREQAIVSDAPGTTRDWVEHPGAIGGAPFTFVDTAGLRETTDRIEQEAIRRTHQQTSTADIILHVFDLTVPAPVNPPWLQASPPADPAQRTPVIAVANKADLPPHRSWSAVIRDENHPLQVSALTSAGLADLNRALIEAADLTDWRQSLVAPVGERLISCCQAALSALTEGAGPQEAARRLENLSGIQSRE